MGLGIACGVWCYGGLYPYMSDRHQHMHKNVDIYRKREAKTHDVDDGADQQIGQGKDGEDEADDRVARPREPLGLGGEEGGDLYLGVYMFALRD